MTEKVAPKKMYILIWAALMCLTALTGGISFINLGSWSTVVAFLIATAKAGLVVTFFMHLRYERQRTIWIWAAASAIWLTLLIVLTMGDYLTRGFLRVPGK
ncbi:MAG TPA: cytochrome C oxidase subunit IV family protein [Verrucomicrobiae bacterium]|nr:cytochrome C oxidase subunit IV family protein [Verrucomicrobiae bacterium]